MTDLMSKTVVEFRGENHLIPGERWRAGLADLFNFVINGDHDWELRLGEVVITFPQRGDPQVVYPKDRPWPASELFIPTRFPMPPTASWTHGAEFALEPRPVTRANIMVELRQFDNSDSLRCALTVAQQVIYLRKTPEGIAYTIASTSGA